MKKLALYSILGVLTFMGLKAHAQPTEAPFAQDVFTDLTTNRPQSLHEKLVPLKNYLVFVDQQDYSPEERDFFKEQAIENYPRVQKRYVEEVNRICEFYNQKAMGGFEFTYLSSTFIPSKNEENQGYMVIRYTSHNEDENLNDKIIFECIRSDDQWFILDGFFEEVPEE